MDAYPLVRIKGGEIEIEFCSAGGSVTHHSIDAVVDFDGLSRPIGVEIIGLQCKLGSNCIDLIVRVIAIAKTDFNCSYDDNCDSFYVRIAEGRSLDQKVVEIDCRLDGQGRITSFHVPLHDAPR